MNMHAISSLIKSFFTKKPKKEEERTPQEQRLFEYPAESPFLTLYNTSKKAINPAECPKCGELRYYSERKDAYYCDCADNLPPLIVDGHIWNPPESVLPGKTDTLPKVEKQDKIELIEIKPQIDTIVKQLKNETNEEKHHINRKLNEERYALLLNRIVALESKINSFVLVDKVEYKALIDRVSLIDAKVWILEKKAKKPRQNKRKPASNKAKNKSRGRA